MKIQLERLPHQVRAINAINKAFMGVDENPSSPDSNYIYANPLLRYAYQDKANIDVKMETGTGKTFVYTQMMYEMHKKGIFKFIIVVPTPSIKEGTKSFITSDYARRYFSTIPGYENVSIQLNEINAGDFSSKKSGRRNFPPQLSEFVESTRQNNNQIQVLLINSGMLSKNSGIHRSDYDQTLLGGETNPMNAIASTRPVVIIDEPHRFPRTKTTYKSIEQLKPQLIVRFGATFPRIYKGRGKNKKSIEDFYRGKPQFLLNAIDSFNQGLVKGINIDYPDITKEEASKLYKVKSVKSKQVVLTRKGKDYILEQGDLLSEVDDEFTGNISYKGSKQLSNDLELRPGMKLIPGTFSQTYQDEILSQAIDRHFEAEERNFMRPETDGNAPRIKTLSLFFIDDIKSFRNQNNNGWLAQHFEKLLTKKLKKLIKKYKMPIEKREKEYLSFLKATLYDLKQKHQKVFAGYFSEDRGNGEKAIQDEVDDILNSKQRLLGFKDKNGEWITRRFLFSKWTLREGWDNPNVFVIAKMRTSGSETSKRQEVGRGLRLPVDEYGHRLKQSEYESRLAFLIGYDEKDFGEKIRNEANEDAPIKVNHQQLTNEMISLIVEERKKSDKEFSEDKLLDDLDYKGIITRSNKFKDCVELNGDRLSGYDALIRLYPELDNKTRVSSDKIREKKSKFTTKVKLQKSNWNQLKDLWKQLSKRKMIKFDGKVDSLAKEIAKDVFNDANGDVFELQRPQIITQEIHNDDNKMLIREKVSDFNSTYITMKYGEFLKQLALRTDLSISLINQLMVNSINRLNGNINYINEKTLNNIVKLFNNRFNNRIKNEYKYVPLDFTGSTSVYNARKDEFVDEISANDIGTFSSDAVSDSKYLYKRPPLRYDSANPELEILKHTYGDKILVYGKLPKRAIKIPRYDNGTTTPDFIFKIERNNKPIYLVVETKAPNMRLGDEEIKTIQKKYFDTLKESGVYYQMATSQQEVHDLIEKLEGKEE